MVIRYGAWATVATLTIGRILPYSEGEHGLFTIVECGNCCKWYIITWSNLHHKKHITIYLTHFDLLTPHNPVCTMGMVFKQPLLIPGIQWYIASLGCRWLWWSATTSSSGQWNMDPLYRPTECVSPHFTPCPRRQWFLSRKKNCCHVIISSPQFITVHGVLPRKMNIEQFNVISY